MSHIVNFNQYLFIVMDETAYYAWVLWFNFKLNKYVLMKYKWIGRNVVFTLTRCSFYKLVSILLDNVRLQGNSGLLSQNECWILIQVLMNIQKFLFKYQMSSYALVWVDVWYSLEKISIANRASIRFFVVFVFHILKGG